MDKQEIKEKAKGKMNKQLLLIDLPLFDKSKIFACNTAIERAPFPSKQKMSFKMITAIPKMSSAMTSFFKSVKIIIKIKIKKEEKPINHKDFNKLMDLLKENKIDQIGYVDINENDIFKHYGVPYRHVIIFTSSQNPEPILSSPSIESQIEVGKVYGITGKAANKASIMLEKLGYGAIPSHSLGGVVDYTKLGFKAGLGYPGRHGLLIEPTSGSNHRLGAIFTNINNLKDFFVQKNEHDWIKDFCLKCGKCVEKCTGNAIYKYAKTNENGYVTCIDYKKCNVEFGAHYGCNICVAVCPFTTIGYEKIKNSFLKTRKKGV